MKEATLGVDVERFSLESAFVVFTDDVAKGSRLCASAHNGIIRGSEETLNRQLRH